MNNKTVHLEMLQGVISRMANNSFLLKGWSVILVSALFALAAAKALALLALLALLPAIAFWILDAYFLRQERLFRKLYDQVRVQKEEDIDFSMNTSVVEKQVAPWGCVAISVTLAIFHGTVVGAVFIILVVLTVLK